jgi:hypothetical protein
MAGSRKMCKNAFHGKPVRLLRRIPGAPTVSSRANDSAFASRVSGTVVFLSYKHVLPRDIIQLKRYTGALPGTPCLGPKYATSPLQHVPTKIFLVSMQRSSIAIGYSTHPSPKSNTREALSTVITVPTLEKEFRLLEWMAEHLKTLLMAMMS